METVDSNVLDKQSTASGILSADNHLSSVEAGHAPDEKVGTVLPGNAVVIPNGGWVAWSTVIGAWLMQFTTFGYANAFGAYQDYYTTTYLDHSSSSDIGWIGSTQLCTLMVLGFFAGRFQDQGYFYPLIIIGTLLMSLSLFMLSLAHQNAYYQVFLAQALGVGLGAGLLYVPALAILAHHFTGPKRATVMMLALSGSSFGGLIHPIMLNNLFESIGFHKAVLASAGLCTSCNIVACLLMKKRLPPKSAEPLIPMVVRFMTDIPYLLTVFAGGCNIIGVFFPIFYIQLYATQHGLDVNFVFYIITLLNASSFVGRLAPSFLTKYVKRVWIFLPCSFICTVLVLVFIVIGSSVPGVAVYTVIYGMISGAYITLLGPHFADFALSVDEIGARVGWGYGIGGLASLIGNPAQGALLTSAFLWWRPALFSGIVLATGSCSFAMSIYMLSRRKKAEH